jgi:hypothetical protein
MDGGLPLSVAWTSGRSSSAMQAGHRPFVASVIRQPSLFRTRAANVQRRQTSRILSSDGGMDGCIVDQPGPDVHCPAVYRGTACTERKVTPQTRRHRQRGAATLTGNADERTSW